LLTTFGGAGTPHRRYRAARTRTEAIVLAFLQIVLKDERGATAIEYGLIAALISLAIVSAITTVGQHLSTTFNTVATKL
jgi:pilus assembly protein Flp/PilA